MEKNHSKNRNLANEHLFVFFRGYRYTIIYLQPPKQFFGVARKKCFCFFKSVFFSKAFGYGKLLVNYGPITGRNLQNFFPLKMQFFPKNLEKTCFSISTQKSGMLDIKQLIWLVVSTPPEKYWSGGIIIPNIWKNKKCSKPPTSNSC